MVKIESCGKIKTGAEVFLYTLNNGQAEASLTNLGAAVVSLKVPDKNSCLKDVVLGYNCASKYENGDKYLGATVGRCSNRIKDGIIFLNGKSFQLSKNEGGNQLHGGFEGFNKKLWNTEIIENGIKFTYISPDGEEGYPAELKTEITYTLKATALEIRYKAISDGDTACALTNHSYFNLDGVGNGDISSQYVQIFAEQFTRNDGRSLPTGEILSVQDTPMDFRTPKQLGADIKSDYEQIKFAKGFDNNWVIKNYDGKSIITAAKAFSKHSGITLEVLTNLPGVQLYSGNYLDGAGIEKKGAEIKNRSAFCLECQYFPNAFVNKNFPQPVLKPGEVYDKTIIYKFGII